MCQTESNSRISVRDQWDRLAESYIRFRALGQGYNDLVETPAMRKLLGEVRGLRVLDAGCGTGDYARYCARNGARVAGVDISGRMIAEARKLASQENLTIDFYEGDLEAMSMFQNGSFDAIVCSVVIADRLREIVAAFSRVLRPDGHLYLSDCHPMFNAGRPEVRDGTPCLVVSGYFDRSQRCVKNPFGNASEEDDAVFRWRYYTLQDYFEALADNGFVVERLLEPQACAESDDVKMARARSYPIFFLLKAAKKK